MAIKNQNVLFNYGSAQVTAGMISFDSTKQAIYVGDGSTANLVTSSVKDVTYTDNVLTIEKIDGAEYKLSFRDVASAKQTMAVFSALETSINANTTAIGTLSDKLDSSINALDAAYKLADSSIRTDFAAADTALDNRLKAVEDAVGENGSVATQISNAIDALAGSAEDVDDSSFVKVAVASKNGQVKTVTVTTTDIASANALSTHTGNSDIHVDASMKERWNAAAAEVEAFFADEVNADEVKDTLKEIQDYIASDAGAAATMTSNITKAQETADGASAAAKAAQDDVDAVEAALGSGFSSNSTVADQLAAVKNTAEAAATKTYVDDSLNLKADKTALAATDASITAIKNSYVISFGGAKGAIAVDTTNSTDGEVKFAMDGSTLKGSVNGLGSAAFTDSTAYDAAGAATTAKNEVIGSVSDESNANTIYGAKKYAAELVAAVPGATVTDVDSTSVADDSSYVTISLKLDNKKVAVNFVSVDTQDVSTATADADGLATAYNVKSYVDAKDTAMDARMDVVEAQLKWNVL